MQKLRSNLVKLSSADTPSHRGTILRGNSRFYRNSYARALYTVSRVSENLYPLCTRLSRARDLPVLMEIEAVMEIEWTTKDRVVRTSLSKRLSNNFPPTSTRKANNYRYHWKTQNAPAVSIVLSRLSLVDLLHIIHSKGGNIVDYHCDRRGVRIWKHAQNMINDERCASRKRLCVFSDTVPTLVLIIRFNNKNRGTLWSR